MAAGDRGTVVWGDGSVRRRTAWAPAVVAVPRITPTTSAAETATLRTADMGSSL
jgi:hypothetical protein